MAIAASLEETQRYVLKSDRKLPEEEQTVFILKQLTSDQNARLRDKIMAMEVGRETAQMRTGSLAQEGCRIGVSGWENLRNSRGQPVKAEIKGGGLSIKSLDAIRPYQSELFNAVMAFNGLSEDEEGNSSVSPDSSSEPDEEDSETN